MPPAEQPADAYRPRELRDRERMRRAAATARAGPRPAMASALARIGAAFDEAAAINDFKMRVERIIRRGPDHPAVHARFAARIGLLRGRDLEAAVMAVEHWWRDERKAFHIASAFGRGSRLSLDILSELRLILRWMRWKQMTKKYDAIVAAVTDPWAVAAE
jgi:hypothetical protein